MRIYDLVEEMTLKRKTIFDMPLRVTFYARVSTKRDAQMNSQENQIQTFTEMIKNNHNWTFIPGYVDTIRGESAANRDNFIKMMEDAKHDCFDLIICKEISRFSRDLLDSIRYTRELLLNDVGVYFSSDGLCTIDRDSELRLGIMASIAQQEVARLSERVKFGHRKAIENGVVLGNSRIFGYRKENKRLIIDESEAPLVRTIFELFATGEYSLRQLEKVLYDKGYRALSGKMLMHNTIKGIIENPKYKGYYCGNKVKVIDYRSKKQKMLPPEEWITFKDETGEIVPAIVDEEIWNRCNAILARRTKDYKGNVNGQRKTSTLSGILTCDHCGTHFYHTSYGHGTKLGIRWQWICRNKKREAASCPTFAIQEQELYALLGDFFTSLTENVDEYIDEFISIFSSVSHESDIQKEIKDIDCEIEKLQKRKKKILDLFTEDLISKNDFVSENNAIYKQLEELTSQKAKVSSELSKQGDLTLRLRDIKNYFQRVFGSKGKDMSPEAIDSLCTTLIDGINISSKSENEMNIAISLKLGTEARYQFTKRTPGIMSKKMIESYEQSNGQ